MDVRRATQRSLIACYTLELLALGIWIGGLIVIMGSVIPAVANLFSTLGMEQGGRLLTRVFDGYNRLVAVAIVILVCTSAFRFWADIRVGLPGIGPTRPEVVLLGTMIVIAVVIVFVLVPRSVVLQEQAFAARDQAAKSAAYEAFFELHNPIRGLYVLNLGLGITLMGIRARDWLREGRGR